MFILENLINIRILISQGFIFRDGILYESIGFDNSSLIKYKLNKKTRFFEIDKIERQDKNIFAEGLELVEENGKKYFYQLTYQNRLIFKYDFDFQLVKTFILDDRIKEGWGLCQIDTTSNYLYLTDGTNKIFKMDMENNKILEEKNIFYKGSPLDSLNECELINNEFYLFNVFVTNKIYKLDKKLNVVEELDFGLLNTITQDFVDNFEDYKKYFTPEQLKTFKNIKDLDYNSLFNGIAYDSKTDYIYLTGKNWPLIFEIKLLKK